MPIPFPQNPLISTFNDPSAPRALTTYDSRFAVATGTGAAGGFNTKVGGGVIFNTTPSANYFTPLAAADGEVYANIETLPAFSGEAYLLGRFRNPTGAASYYNLEINPTTAALLSSATSTTVLGAGPYPLAVGDDWGLQYVGTTIYVWRRPSGGAWALADTVTDSNIQGVGSIGLFDQGSNIVFQNFGGGAYIPDVPSYFEQDTTAVSVSNPLR